MTSKYNYYRDFETKLVGDKLVTVEKKSFIVRGPFGSTRCSNEKSAIKTLDEKIAFDEKFPYTPPTGKRTGK